MDAVWSPDGRWIAYSDCSVDEESFAPLRVWIAESCDLSIVKRDGSASLGLSEGWTIGDESIGGLSPTWSPDGRRIAFVADDDIWIVGSDGEELRNLTRTAERRESEPAWSPDGRLIAFIREDSYEVGDIFVMNPNGSGQRNLTRSGWSYDTSPVWSPDGRMIAFEGSGQGANYPRFNFQIFVVPREGGTLTDLTHHPYRDSEPAWSPDGRMIAFRTKRSAINPLFVMNADGSQPRNVTDAPFAKEPLNPVWSPDGQTLAFELLHNVSNDKDIGVVATGGHAKPRNLTPTPDIVEVNPQWSPDGQEILFTAIDAKTGASGVYVINANGIGKRNLTEQDEPAATLSE